MLDPKLVEAMNDVVAAAVAWSRWRPEDDEDGDSLDEVEGALSEAVRAYLEQAGEE